MRANARNEPLQTATSKLAPNALISNKVGSASLSLTKIQIVQIQSLGWELDFLSFVGGPCARHITAFSRPFVPPQSVMNHYKPQSSWLEDDSSEVFDSLPRPSSLRETSDPPKIPAGTADSSAGAVRAAVIGLLRPLGW
jgi:hypothetical protein